MRLISISITGSGEYKAFRKRNTWFEAKEVCVRDGGDLVNDFERKNLFSQHGVNSALDGAGISSGDDFHVGLSIRQWIWTSNFFLNVKLNFFWVNLS